MTERDLRICTYLRAIAALALECADRPWLWPTFLRVLAMVPGTMRELAGAARTKRIAA